MSMRSREEDDELQRSTKKVKENHSAGSHGQPDGLDGGLGPTKTSLLKKYQVPMNKLLALREQWTMGWN